MSDPALLICAGLDPSGGAGLLADAQVARMHRTRPVGIVTATTVQDTNGVRSAHPADPEVVREQLEVLLSDVEVAAVKLGMIGSTAVAIAIGEALALTRAPVVWDPVLQASAGLAMFEGDLGEAVRALAPHLRLITPNRFELGVLVGRDIESLDDAIPAAGDVARQLEVAVLIKGGHFDGADAIDLLIDGDSRDRFSGTRISDGERVHGTGCALATAIAAKLAHGSSLAEACRAAKRFVREQIEQAVRPGRGAAAVV